jgi:hypothetical protein
MKKTTRNSEKKRLTPAEIAAKRRETTIQRYEDLTYVQDNRNYTRDEFFDRITTLGNPYNMDTHCHYKRTNLVVLTIRALRCNYSTNQWVTFAGARHNGWTIKKGEHATTIYIVKPKINGHTVTWEFYHDYAVANGLNPYHPDDTFCDTKFVFNLDQCKTTTDQQLPGRETVTIDAETFLHEFNDYAKRTKESYDKVREIKPDVFEVETNPVSTDVITPEPEPTPAPKPKKTRKTVKPEPKQEPEPQDPETLEFNGDDFCPWKMTLVLSGLKTMKASDLNKFYNRIVKNAVDKHLPELKHYAAKELNGAALNKVMAWQ